MSGFLALNRTASYLGGQDLGYDSVCACAYSSSWEAEYASDDTALATEGTKGRSRWVQWGNPLLTSSVLLNKLEGQTLTEKPPPCLSGLPICLLPPQEGTYRASVEAEASQHCPCDRIERATKNRGLLDEGAEAAVIMGTRQINHPWQVRQKVAQLLFHLLPTEFVIGMFQVVVCDQVSAACQLRVA